VIPAPILETAIAETWALMREIGRRSETPPGHTRPAFSEQEEMAATLVREFLAARGLPFEHDAFGNITILLPGTEEGLPAVTSGSHLDTVAHGGNYDGMAGTAAALAVVAAAHTAGLRTRHGLRALAMRGEESPWFNMAYLGSQLLLNYRPRAELGARRRIDTGLTLEEHVKALGYPFRTDAEPILTPANTACFLELHIEQGPLLIERDLPAAVASAIRGNIRYPAARCLGEYGHASAVPRQSRRDAVMAVAELALGLDALWAELHAKGDDNLVVTLGRFGTDPAQHAMTKVPGEVGFSLAMGATSAETLALMRARKDALVAEISAKRGVTFEMGAEVTAEPVALDEATIALLEDGLRAQGIAPFRLPTVGHDSGIFALSGIPSAMLMLRNPGGSHNPKEHLEEADYAVGCRVLAAAMLKAAG
jgi:N-carbamoyl-L-amino-acid hydrolase